MLLPVPSCLINFVEVRPTAQLQDAFFHNMHRSQIDGQGTIGIVCRVDAIIDKKENIRQVDYASVF